MAKSKLSGQKFVSRGTGLHIDSNLYSMWRTEISKGKFIDLDRMRPFQSFYALSDANPDQKLKDGGLEVVPGFHLYAEEYFGFLPDQTSRRVAHLPHSTKFKGREDTWILNCIRKVQRMPENWTPYTLDTAKSQDLHELIQKSRRLVTEHDKMDYIPIQRGDFILWDIRLPHQNSDANDSDTIRSVFYHAYLLAEPQEINIKTVKDILKSRKTRDHQPDFNKKWTDIEKQGLDPLPELDTPFTKMLYNVEEWDVNVGDEIISRFGNLLTDKHIAFYKQYGYVVIENMIDSNICDQLYNQILSHAKFCGCDVGSLMQGGLITAEHWDKIGGAFGAMVEFFWLPIQEQLRLDERAYAVTSKLLSETWARNDQSFSCPFADRIDPRKLWLYNDRVNIRVPDAVIRKMQQ
jgi:hypothetical protein